MISRTLKRLTHTAAGLALAAGLTSIATPSAAQEPFIGEVRLVGFNFCPRGWTGADGQLLPIAQNSALFSLYGTFYGGDGRTTFGLPDLRGRVPTHLGNGPGLTPRNIGQKFGSETETLTVGQMPSHNHMVNASKELGTNGGPARDYLARPSQNTNSDPRPAHKQFVNTITPGQEVQMNPGMIANSGGNQPHNNIQPTLVLRYCVALQGLYPSRN
ncbi:MAG: tail fiber protein [Pseudomonadota bacterium]